MMFMDNIITIKGIKMKLSTIAIVEEGKTTSTLAY